MSLSFPERQLKLLAFCWRDEAYSGRRPLGSQAQRGRGRGFREQMLAARRIDVDSQT